MNILQEILWLTIMPSRQKLGIILENKSFQKNVQYFAYQN